MASRKEIPDSEDGFQEEAEQLQTELMEAIENAGAKFFSRKKLDDVDFESELMIGATLTLAAYRLAIAAVEQDVANHETYLQMSFDAVSQVFQQKRKEYALLVGKSPNPATGVSKRSTH